MRLLVRRGGMLMLVCSMDGTFSLVPFRLVLAGFADMLKLVVDSECWCANSVTSSATLTDGSMCNYACSGQADATCGGNY